MKISTVRINNNCLVVIDGQMLHTNNFSDDRYKTLNNYIVAYQRGSIDEITAKERIKSLFAPTYKENSEQERYQYLTSRDASKPSVITKRNSSYYIMDVSELSLPLDLVEKIYRAEDDNNSILVDTYKNFWTLVSLNPDSRVRNDLFAFINAWNIKIAHSGLLIMYRNADIKTEGTTYSTNNIDFIAKNYDHIKHVAKKSPRHYFVVLDDDGHMSLTRDEYEDGVIGTLSDVYDSIINGGVDASDPCATPTYTDHYSHKFEIKLGEIVSMPREKCCADQTQSCAPSLHAASKDWLKKNYFGDVGMKVLVNPADVVATPITPDRRFQEGKLRCCAYYPFSIIEYNNDGMPIDDVDDGVDYASEADFIQKIAYTGLVNNDDIDHYSLPIPQCVEINQEQVYENLLDLANKFSHNI